MTTTTALMPVDPAVSPQQVSRVLNLRANLLPQEILDTRQSRRTRALVIFTLVMVIAMMGLWRWHVTNLYHNAIDEETQVEAQLTAAQAKLKTPEYATLNETRTTKDAMAEQLATLLANDLPWSAMLDQLRATGVAHQITVTGVNGALLDGAGDSTVTLPGSTASRTVGTLTLTGSAPDKKAVAKYVTALAGLKTVADPYLTNAAENDNKVDFSLTVNITEEALCGRFSTKTCASGGK